MTQTKKWSSQKGEGVDGREGRGWADGLGGEEGKL